MLREDLANVFDQDPAARSKLEVILTYSGMHAIWNYRIAHWFWKKHCFFIGRVLSQFARFMTGIEIHPGAVIGRRFFIDHGTGIVIGETCEIGNDVTLFQGVTLGGTGKEKGKRHPTIGDDVLISCGARVLGSIIIGNHSKIGAGSVVLHDVPSNATVVGIPGRIVRQNGLKVHQHDLDHTNLPDPVADKLNELERQICDLREHVMAAHIEYKREHSKKQIESTRVLYK
ncbi:serine O-acetyltransferase [Sporolactobacillus shoreicorticis]|uniref:Serine acetyltransferase n=1 Tax=Sporolactobacillus shoreicorticis TaxID=1923877 RepID=A0ABW5RYC8_9BACL|nr:serine O-acetyltransferase EpsC [Sporolactobacillus shoreicorticis]MCO7124864.1 serine O-acetyltransferase [Sporolactobacillus shoreicorticis]